jgi:hypothetical protein
MALPVPPTNPNDSIPNNPFYYPETDFLVRQSGPVIVGSGLSIDYASGIISASGGGGGGVSAILAGTGINLTANTGIVTISNDGVVDVVAGSGISVTKVGGTYTVTNTSPGGPTTGTVTQVNTGAGLTGGPITSTGTIALTPTGVAAATYTNPTITVDQYGRITFASPGAPTGVSTVLATLPLRSTGVIPATISIDPASLAVCGAVQLCDAVNSTSTTKAATPSAVKQAYDLATTANANVVTALATASAAFTDANTALITSTTANANALQALSDAFTAQATANTALATANIANTTATTAIALATTADINATTALTQVNQRIPCSAYQAKGDILIGCGSTQFSPLAVGGDGAILIACAACPLGVTWGSGCLFPGTVTAVTAGTGLTGGTITNSGTIAIANTGVTAGSYAYANFTVNAQGQITAATAGSPPVTSIIGNAPISVVSGAISSVSIAPASLASCGAVQLYNSTNSTSTSLALTAAAGKFLQDQIDALVLSPNQSLAGTLDAAGAILTSVTPDGAAAGFAAGSNLPVASLSNDGFFVIVSEDGVYTPPGGIAYNCTKGDWFISNGASWQFLDVGGASIPYATTITDGTVCLSTFAAAVAGVDNNTALTPATATSAFIPRACATAKGTLIAGTGPSTPVALPINPVAGQVLTVDMTCPTGMKWATNAAIPCACILSKGSLIVGAGASIPFPLAASLNDGDVLTVCAACFTGLTWTPRTTGTVTSVATGTGLIGGTITTSGTIALSNTGVAPGTYQNANITVDAQGRLTAASGGASYIPCSLLTSKGTLITAVTPFTPVALGLGTPGQVLTVDYLCAQGMKWSTPTIGTMTSVTAGTGLTGGTITTSGTIALAQTGVIPGIYSNASITVDSLGRVVVASSNPNPLTGLTATLPVTVTPGTTPNIAVNYASLISSGVVQLTDSLSSPSNTLALTASAGALLQSQITALTVSSNLTFAGTLNAAGSVLDYVTPSGALAGFVSGSNLPAASATNTDYFVSVTDPGVYTPPGGAPVTATRGDWFVSDGTAWNFLNVGTDIPSSTTLVEGIIREATNAETQAGVDANSAVTPASLQSKVSNSVTTTSSTTIASSTAVKCAYDVAMAAIPKACLALKGSLVSADATASPVNVSVGLPGQILSANPATLSGLNWIDPCQGTVTLINTGTGLCGGPIPVSGTIALANTAVVPGSYTNASFTVDAQGRLTAAASGTPPITALNVGTGLCGVPTANITGTTAPIPVICLPDIGPGAVCCNLVKSVCLDVKGRVTAVTTYPANPVLWCDFTGQGSILAGTSPAGTFTALPLGTAGQVLSVCTTAPSGLAWITKADIPCSSFTAKGQLLVGCTTAATYAALPPGTNGQVLTACSTCPTGLYWAAPVTTACYSNRARVLVASSMPVGTYCCALFTGFGSGLYPIELSVSAELTRAGVIIAGGRMYLWSTVGGASSAICWRMTGGSGVNQVTQNPSLSWVFPPGASVSLGVAIQVTDNAGPGDFFTSYATATIKEVH